MVGVLVGFDVGAAMVGLGVGVTGFTVGLGLTGLSVGLFEGALVIVMSGELVGRSIGLTDIGASSAKGNSVVAALVSPVGM